MRVYVNSIFLRHFYSLERLPWAKLSSKPDYNDISVPYSKSSCHSLLLTLYTHPWGTTKNIKRKVLKMCIKKHRKAALYPKYSLSETKASYFPNLSISGHSWAQCCVER